MIPLPPMIYALLNVTQVFFFFTAFFMLLVSQPIRKHAQTEENKVIARSYFKHFAYYLLISGILYFALAFFKVKEPERKQVPPTKLVQPKETLT
jgi:phosphotransferase system  glucose/maltose/N-acetylglucosamine-specific IIC component